MAVTSQKIQRVFPVRTTVRTLPHYLTLLKNPRKTERGAGQFLVRLPVRAAPFALLTNSRKTERGAGQFLVRLAVRAAPLALLGAPQKRKSPPSNLLRLASEGFKTRLRC
jgi:hypothetical protein